MRIFRNDGGQADFGTEIYEGSNVQGIRSARIILNVRKVAADNRGWTDFSITGNSRKSRMAAKVGEQSDIGTLETLR